VVKITRSRDVASQGGLVLISSTTVGTGVASVTISNCFSSTYDNYLINISGGSGSAINYSTIQYSNSTGATYSYSGFYQNYTSTAIGGESGTGVTAAWIGTNHTTSSLSAIIYNPFQTIPTTFTSQWITTTSSGMRFGYDSSAVSNTGFTYATPAQTMTGKTISVYGYKK